MATVNVEVGVTPELQTVIDDAKAECEKVVEENTQLKQKIAILEQAGGNQSELLSENSRLKDAAVLADKALKDAEAQVVGIKTEFQAFKTIFLQCRHVLLNWKLENRQKTQLQKRRQMFLKIGPTIN